MNFLTKIKDKFPCFFKINALHISPKVWFQVNWINLRQFKVSGWLAKSSENSTLDYKKKKKTEKNKHVCYNNMI